MPYIANYFIEKTDRVKQEEIITLVLAPRVSYYEKTKIFYFLVNKYHPEFKKKHKGFLDHLAKIAEHRNVFAHYPLHATDESIAKFKKLGAVSFYKFKDSKLKGSEAITLTNAIEYTPESFEQINSLIYSYIVDIRILVINK